METLHTDFIGFLLRAKHSTYAANGQENDSSRPNSHDLRYEEENGWLYIDSYLGGEQFAGEEAVWKDGVPVWSMNYCGRVTGNGFDGDFLKEALLRVPTQAPYRGPIEYQDGSFLYCNTYAGELGWFFGREEIYHSGVSIYECIYHGGMIR